MSGLVKFLKSAFRDYVEHRVSVGSILVGLVFLLTFLGSLFSMLKRHHFIG